MGSGAPVLLVRADADAEIGTGHVMRCLALAQAHEDEGGRAVFLVASCPGGVRARLADEGMEVRNLDVAPGSADDARWTVAAARELGATWVVVDGYRFDGAFQASLRDGGLRMLLLDDYGHADRYEADLVLNQNLTADPWLYGNRRADTRLLLGPGHVLLRREFRARIGAGRPGTGRGARPRVLVTLGGSGAEAVIATAIRGVARAAAAFDAVALVGTRGGAREALEEVAASADPPVRLQAFVPDVAPLMERADLAVIAGGSTCWETAFMGVPALVVVTAENQRANAKRLDEAGVAVNLGAAGALTDRAVAAALDDLAGSPERAGRMAAAGRALVDGRGTARVLRAMRDVEAGTAPPEETS